MSETSKWIEAKDVADFIAQGWVLKKGAPIGPDGEYLLRWPYTSDPITPKKEGES